MCQVLEVSKSGYYRWQKRKDDPEEKSLSDLILTIYNEHKQRYGYRRVHEEMKRRGLSINKKRVARIMHELGLKAHRKQGYKSTTNSKHSNLICENLLKQNFKTEGINYVWLSDITGIKTMEGWVYLTVVMDLYSRRILGWELGETLKQECVINALRKALSQYSPKGHLIFHSDRGVQFTAEEFRKILSNFSIDQSMSGVGNCYDNAPMESFFATLKMDILIRKGFQTKRMTRVAIFEYLESYYNKKRLHSSLNYRTPDEVFYEQKIN